MNSEYTFEWDDSKSELNIQKHKISFHEATSIFYDDEALLIPDPDHSYDESRFVIIGQSNVSNLLLVSHCYREENVIRIISARKATKREKLQYNIESRW